MGCCDPTKVVRCHAETRRHHRASWGSAGQEKGDCLCSSAPTDPEILGCGWDRGDERTTCEPGFGKERLFLVRKFLIYVIEKAVSR